MATTNLQAVPTRKRVRQFRQTVLWPLQLMQAKQQAQIQRHWEVLERKGADNPWREVVDEFMGDPSDFRERDYTEFTTFLPHVQRFLYGEGRTKRIAGVGPADPNASPMRVYRRDDVAAVRMTPHAGAAPLTFTVTHVDLYFFYDIDIVLLS